MHIKDKKIHSRIPLLRQIQNEIKFKLHIFFVLLSDFVTSLEYIANAVKRCVFCKLHPADIFRLFLTQFLLWFWT